MNVEFYVKNDGSGGKSSESNFFTQTNTRNGASSRAQQPQMPKVVCLVTLQLRGKFSFAKF